MKKRILAGLMTLVMMFSLLPASALATEPEPEQGQGTSRVMTVNNAEENPVIVKSVNQAGTELTLEAYVTNDVTVTSTSKPVDIVLVLDQSGSMDYDFAGNTVGNKIENSRQYAMKQAVNSFIGKVAENYNAATADHRMAIVTFGSSANTLKDWTSVDSIGKSALQGAINGLPSKIGSAATFVDTGMEEAAKLMNIKYDGQNKAEHQKIVIVFTDGVPNSKNSNDFSTGTANKAITQAKTMKDNGVKIYTIGIFDGADPTQLYGSKFDRFLVKDTPCNGNVGEYWGSTNIKTVTSGGESIRDLDVPATNRFLNYLSSNFSDATEIGIQEDYSHGLLSGEAWKITKNFTRTSSDYYMTAGSSEGLNSVFTQISDTISSLKLTVGADTVLSDTLSEYFTLNGTATVKKAQCTDVDSYGNYTWSTPEAVSGVTVAVDSQNSKKITVTGFDYSENAVTTTTEGNTTTYSGSKLVVTIPIKPDTNCTSWEAGENNYKTNSTATGEQAGLSGYTETGKTEPKLAAELSSSPEAPVTEYTVTYAYTNAPTSVTAPTDNTAYITGQTATIAAAPTSPKDDDDYRYTFEGWTINNTAAGERVEIGTADVNVVGNWRKTAHTYQLAYNWGTSAPSDKTLPTNNNSYETADAAKEAKDTTFTRETTSTAANAGTAGTWTFSGWSEEPTASDADDNNVVTLTYTGTWSFVPNNPNPNPPETDPTDVYVYAKTVAGSDHDKDIIVQGVIYNDNTGTSAHWATLGKLSTTTDMTTATAATLGAKVKAGTDFTKHNGNATLSPNLVESWDALKQEDGAAGYVEASQKTWHLDGTIYGYRVIYCDNDGTELANFNDNTNPTYYLSSATGVSLTTAEPTSTDGETFLGWSKTPGATTADPSITVDFASGDMKVYAVWDDGEQPEYIGSITFKKVLKGTYPSNQKHTFEVFYTSEGKEIRVGTVTVTGEREGSVPITPEQYTNADDEKFSVRELTPDLPNGYTLTKTEYSVRLPDSDAAAAEDQEPTYVEEVPTKVPVDSFVTVRNTYTYTPPTTPDPDDGHDNETTYYTAIKKVDAQDGHALRGATFYLYDENGIRHASSKAVSDKDGYAVMTISASSKPKNGTYYAVEETAPDGYVTSDREYSVKFYDSKDKARDNAVEVLNYRGKTPGMLNDTDHFAYVIGYRDGLVRPYGLITRAETTTIFFRLLKDNVRDNNLRYSNVYTDVPDTYWANIAISTMSDLGIVQGYSDGTFNPYAPITRAQFAAICARFDTGVSTGRQTFSDINGHWAQGYIERAAELGWIKGFEDGTFRPDTYITRAQAMTMINRVLNRIPEEADDLLDDMNVWPDNTPDMWCYLAVQEATNSHDFKHKSGNYETWTDMNRDPDWTRYEN